jgi:hypothetical protein
MKPTLDVLFLDSPLDHVFFSLSWRNFGKKGLAAVAIPHRVYLVILKLDLKREPSPSTSVRCCSGIAKNYADGANPPTNAYAWTLS